MLPETSVSIIILPHILVRPDVRLSEDDDHLEKKKLSISLKNNNNAAIIIKNNRTFIIFTFLMFNFFTYSIKNTIVETIDMNITDLDELIQTNNKLIIIEDRANTFSKTLFLHTHT